MLIIFLLSIILVFYTVAYGFIVNNNLNYNTYNYTKSLIFSIIIIFFLSLLLNFYFPINNYIATLIPIFGLILSIKFRKLIFRFSFFKFLILISILVTLFLIESNVYRPDAGLYHLPFIGIINSEKIIIGISNLHSRYSMTSIIQYFDAINNNLILKNNGIVFSQALIASAIIINFISLLGRYVKKKNYNFHFFFLFFVVIYIAYKMNRYSEFGNDAPSHYLVFFLISEILLNIKKIKLDNFLNNLLISLFIVQSKLTLIFIILLNIIHLNKINLKELILDKKFIFINIFFIAWIGKNILFSGCALYPIEFTCMKNLSWTNLENIKEVSLEAEVWTKGWSELLADHKFSMDEFKSNFNWIKIWLFTHGKLILKILIPYLIFTILLLIFLLDRTKKKKVFLDKKIYLIFFILIFCSIIWFIKAPLFRYGYSFLVSSIVFILSYLFMKYELKFNLQNKIFVSILLMCISIITFKNIYRIYITSNNYVNHPWPKYYSMGDNNIQPKFKFDNINGLKIAVPINDYCMYTNSVCSHYGIKSDIQIFKSNNYYVILSK